MGLLCEVEISLPMAGLTDTVTLKVPDESTCLKEFSCLMGHVLLRMSNKSSERERESTFPNSNVNLS